MRDRTKLRLAIIALLILCGASPLLAQQRGQWVPGQWGLNAGIAPDPGFTYQEMTINYSADQLNNSNGNKIPGITGTYSFWAVENIFLFVPKHKFLGAYLVPYYVLTLANGSLDADLGNPPRFSGNAGGEGVGDMYFQPLNLAWHFNRADIMAGDGFFAPTGRYTPGATNNIGSGYWGNDITTNTTVSLTKNKGTQINLATIWEIHTEKRGTNITPGQTFTMEWGLGQALPLKKDLSRLLQVGVVGYDQYQTTQNSGLTKILPYYSYHGLGVQSNFIMPVKALNFFFKYYWSYRALATTQGRTIVFGGSWTLRIPRPTPQKQ
jgi:hypothetical protein